MLNLNAVCRAAMSIATAATVAGGAVVINEIHYNPAGTDDATEFIELFNTGTQSVDLAGWRFSEGVGYIFPTGSVLAGGAYLVVARDLAAFTAAYPLVRSVQGPFTSGKLDNGGERVTLADARETIVSTVRYADRAPWPQGPDGDGPSLELRHPALPLAYPQSWAASSVFGGTPGQSNSTLLTAPTVLDLGCTPATPSADAMVRIRAIPIANAVTALGIVWATGSAMEVELFMTDDGEHADDDADDGCYGAAMPAMPNGTLVRYYYRLRCSDGVVEAPALVTTGAPAPSMTARLSYRGLETTVTPRDAWHVATTTGQATSSQLYLYLNGAGSVLVDDVAIMRDGTNYIANGTFAGNDAGWTKAGNHSGSTFEPTVGYGAAGCERIVADAAGGGSGNSVSCQTTSSLALNGPQYVLRFAYRAPPVGVLRPWLSYYVSATNWRQMCINEFMAYNIGPDADENGEFSDWLELYNTGATAVDLYGCGVSDDAQDLFKWVFPACVVPPRGFVRIFASGKNRGTTPLHTNFRLAAQGDAIYLTARDGRPIDALETGVMPANIARGRMPDGAADIYYFDRPTPGAPNATNGYLGIAEEPGFSRPGGYFSGTLSLTLSVVTAGAGIRYTTDGSIPTAASSVYTAPLRLSSTTRVAARVFAPGLLPGPVVNRYYAPTPPVNLVTSTLPIIVVDTAGAAIPNEPKVAAMMGVIWGGSGVVNRITDPFAHFEGRIGIEIRGESSQGFPKKQYRIETRQADDSNRDVALLDFPADNDWILHAPYSDKTLMRNVLAYHLGGRMGLYTSRTRYFELVLNGQYQGVYVLMENIKRARHRVNISRSIRGATSEPEITGGYILKKDKPNAGDVYLRTSRTELTCVYPDGADLTTAHQNWITAHLRAFEAALDSSAYTNPVTGYTAYIDAASWVDTYILVQAMRNIDGLRLSAYMHKDRAGTFVMGPAWDYNLSLGNADYYDGWKTNGWYETDTPYWWNRMLTDPAFVQRCRLRWRDLRKDVFDIPRLKNLIAATVAQLDGAQQRNFIRWPILGTYVWPNWYIGATYQREVAWMQTWLIDRIAWLDSQWHTLIAGFTSDVSLVMVNSPLQFEPQCIGRPQHYAWRFGDGTASTSATPVHAYATPGDYTVTLVVSNYVAGIGWFSDAHSRTGYVQVVPEAGLTIVAAALALVGIRARAPRHPTGAL